MTSALDPKESQEADDLPRSICPLPFGEQNAIILTAEFHYNDRQTHTLIHTHRHKTHKHAHTHKYMEAQTHTLYRSQLAASLLCHAPLCAPSRGPWLWRKPAPVSVLPQNTVVARKYLCSSWVNLRKLAKLPLRGY